MVANEYKVLSANSVQELQNEVNVFLTQNWQPIAGMTSIIYMHRQSFHQTMVRYESPPCDHLMKIVPALDSAEYVQCVLCSIKFKIKS